ncbi:MAG: restriction endonuclease subunit R [Gomphosphaeria aponina SAG 52.96 = DSM 107014]|uniref:Restriction endonuclease subunit R n=1 Tax=Gomphosphaeria aponina SAG 52.96 = DSM 107014 TaxID=1521640 RepID=A0A941GXU2_9CHRO|nr:restriction endonuclease subunit R [Gomphosphaeria aponina SAG 52.96 = DSM 107014]
MTTLISARNLSIGEVHQILGYQREYNDSFTSILSLENLTDFEEQEVGQIQDDFDNYLSESTVGEGQIKLLVVAPLLRLAGFYRYPIKITLEEGIAEILIEDEDTKITGRLDILAVNKQRQTTDKTSFWVLVIEAKNSGLAPSAGLPQLLTYAYQSLEHQDSVWGLTTNGSLYQFVHIQGGKNNPTYQLMPFLNFMERLDSRLILQVFKAICQL